MPRDACPPPTRPLPAPGAPPRLDLPGYAPPPPPQPCPACGAPERAPHRPVPVTRGGLAATARCPLSPGPRCPGCGAPPGGRHGICGYHPGQPDLTALAAELIRVARHAGAAQGLLWRISGLPDPREQVAVAARIITRLAAPPGEPACEQMAAAQVPALPAAPPGPLAGACHGVPAAP